MSHPAARAADAHPAPERPASEEPAAREAQASRRPRRRRPRGRTRNHPDQVASSAPTADAALPGGAAPDGTAPSSASFTGDLADLQARITGLGPRDAHRLGSRLHTARRSRDGAARAAALTGSTRPSRRPSSASPPAPPPSRRSATPRHCRSAPRREDIAAAIRDHQVVIVAGETGSGKTTQLPKICLELGRGVRGVDRAHPAPPARRPHRRRAHRRGAGTPSSATPSATRCGSPTRSATTRWSS